MAKPTVAEERRADQQKVDRQAAGRASRDELRAAIAEHAQAGQAFFIMNGLSALVASYGLLVDSAAGVIGAMIIATLLGPITGIALALVDGNNRLLRTALSAEAMGVGLVMAVSMAIGRMHSDLPLTAEMLARTKPNLLDLMIALGGGAAGAYASISPRVSSAIVGVAVATALVPPLSTSGLCLARGETALAWGSFVLFAANLVAIQIAASVVLWLHGFHKIMPNTSWGWVLVTRNMPSIVLFLAMGGLLSYNFQSTVAAQAYKNAVRQKLIAALSEYPGVRLVDLWVERRSGETVVMAVLRAPYSFAPEKVSELQASLPTDSGRKPTLHVRSVLTKEATAREYLHEPKPEPPPEEPAPAISKPEVEPIPSSGDAPEEKRDSTSDGPQGAPAAAGEPPAKQGE